MPGGGLMTWLCRALAVQPQVYLYTDLRNCGLLQSVTIAGSGGTTARLAFDGVQVALSNLDVVYTVRAPSLWTCLEAAELVEHRDSSDTHAHTRTRRHARMPARTHPRTNMHAHTHARTPC
jgi:hypothetical protein